jgi:hypothetical protein
MSGLASFMRGDDNQSGFWQTQSPRNHRHQLKVWQRLEESPAAARCRPGKNAITAIAPEDQPADGASRCEGSGRDLTIRATNPPQCTSYLAVGVSHTDSPQAPHFAMLAPARCRLRPHVRRFPGWRPAQFPGAWIRDDDRCSGWVELSLDPQRHTQPVRVLRSKAEPNRRYLTLTVPRRPGGALSSV